MFICACLSSALFCFSLFPYLFSSVSVVVVIILAPKLKSPSCPCTPQFVTPPQTAAPSSLSVSSPPSHYSFFSFPSSPAVPSPPSVFLFPSPPVSPPVYLLPVAPVLPHFLTLPYSPPLSSSPRSPFIGSPFFSPPGIPGQFFVPALFQPSSPLVLCPPPRSASPAPPPPPGAPSLTPPPTSPSFTCISATSLSPPPASPPLPPPHHCPPVPLSSPPPSPLPPGVPPYFRRDHSVPELYI